MIRKLGIVALFSAAALAGCNGSSSGSGQPVACNLLIPLSPKMIYPIPGATGVPDGQFTLVVSFAPPGSITLASGATTLGPLASAPVPSPLPTPNATPSPSSAQTYAGFAVSGALSSAATYTVTDTMPAVANCPATSQTIGSFTTQ
jgi:hypothetical protein